MADIARDFSAAPNDQPWDDPDFTNVTNQLDLVGGNIVGGDDSDWGRVVYDAEDIDSGADVITIEVTLGIGPTATSDIGGPAFLTNGGLGYVASQNGNTVSVNTVSTINTAGAKMYGDSAGGWVDPGGNIPGTAATGGRLALQLYDLQTSPRIRCLYNDVVFGGDQAIDDTSGYITNGRPGMSQFWGDNQTRGFTAFAVTGLDLGGFTLDAVTGIDNDTQFTISGTGLDTVTGVTLKQTGAADVSVSFTDTATLLTCTGIDFHTTEFVDGAVTVSVTDSTTTLTMDATLDFSNTWVSHTAVSVDAVLGMWKDIPAATADDISHSPATIAGSAVSVDTAGMLMVISPAVATGTTAQWWHFDVSTRAWTEVEATINQDNVTGPTFTTPQTWLVTEGVSDTYDASTYATSSGGSIAYVLNPAVPGFSVASGTGIVSYDGTTPAGQYWLSLDCTDDNGTTTMPQIPVTVALDDLLISNKREASVSQTTATLLCDINSLVGEVHFAIRTSGAYGPGDIANIVNGTGAVWFQDRAAAQTTYAYSTGLAPDTLQYYGIVQHDDDGNYSNVLSGSFPTQALPSVTQTGKVPVERP